MKMHRPLFSPSGPATARPAVGSSVTNGRPFDAPEAFVRNGDRPLGALRFPSVYAPSMATPEDRRSARSPR